MEENNINSKDEADEKHLGVDPSVLYIGVMVHLEGYNLQKDEIYNSYKQDIINLSNTFSNYGAKLTFELKEPIDACEKRNDYYFKNIEDMGHAIGVHADAGGVPSADETWQDMSIVLKIKKEKLEKQNVTVRHVSGYCSPLDWVSAVINAGYSFVTGGVTYCLMSLSEEKIPEEYKDCANPGLCHEPYPENMADRMHPWTIKKGFPWIEHHDDGELVYLPSAVEGLPYLSEKEKNPDFLGEPAFDQGDLDVYIKRLDEALDNLDPKQPNFMYVGWSYGKRMPESFREDWLDAIQPYVDNGQVKWKTIPEMYDLYIYHIEMVKKSRV